MRKLLLFFSLAILGVSCSKNNSPQANGRPKTEKNNPIFNSDSLYNLYGIRFNNVEKFKSFNNVATWNGDNFFLADIGPDLWVAKYNKNKELLSENVFKVPDSVWLPKIEKSTFNQRLGYIKNGICVFQRFIIDSTEDVSSWQIPKKCTVQLIKYDSIDNKFVCRYDQFMNNNSPELRMNALWFNRGIIVDYSADLNHNATACSVLYDNELKQIYYKLPNDDSFSFGPALGNIIYESAVTPYFFSNEEYLFCGITVNYDYWELKGYKYNIFPRQSEGHAPGVMTNYLWETSFEILRNIKDFDYSEPHNLKSNKWYVSENILTVNPSITGWKKINGEFVKFDTTATYKIDITTGKLL